MTHASPSRRDLLKLAAAGTASAAVAAATPRALRAADASAPDGGPRTARHAARPNVLLIMTDDQGYGDLGCHGNTMIRTPNLDRLYGESTRLTQFHVCPVCAPTRASLMTGRYNYRTGAVDTYLGRAMMHGEEVTIAEMLAGAGYRTGIFGKWHLGDNYPLRPTEQGFAESLVHKGGGVGQPADPPGNSYFDPVLFHNSKPVKTRGYCTDVYTDAAMKFIEAEAKAGRPFFVYLPTNCPHGPFLVDKKYAQPYLKQGVPQPMANFYGMITNIDENVGRLLAKLKALGIEGDTIVIFLTDNGTSAGLFRPRPPRRPRRRAAGKAPVKPPAPKWAGHAAGMRARKGSVYQGGVRVPFFIRWPGKIAAGRDIDRIAAHIDVAPTLLAACGAAAPKGVKLDGLNLMPLLTGQAPAKPWPERTLFFQWHRGDSPQMYRACAARDQRWKIVHLRGVAPGTKGRDVRFELYDLQNDPGEKTNLAGKHPEIVAKLRKRYEAWFRDVSATRGYDPPRIHLGTPHEDPTILTRQDWRGPRAGWGGNSLGHWEVLVAKAGAFDVKLRFSPPRGDGEAVFRMAKVERKMPVKKGQTSCTFAKVDLPAGPGRLEAWVEVKKKTVGVRYVEVKGG